MFRGLPYNSIHRLINCSHPSSVKTSYVVHSEIGCKIGGFIGSSPPENQVDQAMELWLVKCTYYMGVSKNKGTPKSSVFIGFSIINHPFWGPTPIFGNTHIGTKTMANKKYCNFHQLSISPNSKTTSKGRATWKKKSGWHEFMNWHPFGEVSCRFVTSLIGFVKVEWHIGHTHQKTGSIEKTSTYPNQVEWHIGHTHPKQDP